ncbi:phosphatase [Lithospermum erythrorhizon]|uniref:Phosphatase n=1 Tax=Lithospermum erythrorhizon TaxID=34254 RepID=A0AAV3NK01_LITER
MRRRHSVQHQPQHFWPRVVVRKWLNITTKDSDYSADSDSDSAYDSDQEFIDLPRESRFKNEKPDGAPPILDETLPRRRRRNSETFRAQYINNKEIRVCAATWNVAGKLPPDDLDIDGWLDIDDPADIYVIGLQEIIPLNAGNIFGAEDNRPVSKWENIIRESLNKVPPTTKYKSYSDPPSPSRFKPSDDAPDIEDEILLGSDSEGEEEIYPINDNGESICFEDVGFESGAGKYGLPIIDEYVSTDDKITAVAKEIKRQLSSSKRLERLNCLKTDECEADDEDSNHMLNRKLTKTFSGTERVGLSWPERPLDLLPHHKLERPNSFKSVKSLNATKSFRTYNSFKSCMNDEDRNLSDIALLGELDLETIINRRRKSAYVRIVSKQMVGIFLTVWVRRSLRRHIQHLRVSCVGVGAMGYIGNKGSISVSMSVYQTLFCLVCTHLTSGEKDTEFAKRNADVHEIHRRTQFNSPSAAGLPKRIYDHERIIWLGDLNYRINLPYEKTRELMSNKDWPKLVEGDQLIKELKKGRAFDGWSEGKLDFAPTYKYEVNSQTYIHPEAKAARRNPAWCDRILSFGKGMRLLRYRRTELLFSDHRPVTATYVVEVEEFSPRRLQRALTFTDAEVEDEQLVSDFQIEKGMSQLRF